MLNAVTRRGPFLGNSAGVIAMVYNGFNSFIGHMRGKHDSANIASYYRTIIIIVLSYIWQHCSFVVLQLPQRTLRNSTPEQKIKLNLLLRTTLSDTDKTRETCAECGGVSMVKDRINMKAKIVRGDS